MLEHAISATNISPDFWGNTATLLRPCAWLSVTLLDSINVWTHTPRNFNILASSACEQTEAEASECEQKQKEGKCPHLQSCITASYCTGSKFPETRNEGRGCRRQEKRKEALRGYRGTARRGPWYSDSARLLCICMKWWAWCQDMDHPFTQSNEYRLHTG